MIVDEKDLDGAPKTGLEIVVEKRELLDALKRVRVFTRKVSYGVLPTLGGIRVDSCGYKTYLSATNVDALFRTEVNAQVGFDGAVVLPAKPFIDSVDVSPHGTVKLVQDGSDAGISSLAGETNVKGLPVEEWLSAFENFEGETFMFKADVLRDNLGRVLYAASGDSTHRLRGIHFSNENDEMVFSATDSYRLVTRKTGMKPLSENIIVPAEPLKSLVRWLPDEDVDVTVTVSEQEVFFEWENNLLATRLVLGNFPNIEALMPDSQRNSWTFDVAEMAEAVKRAGKVCLNGSPVRFMLNGTAVNVQGVSETAEVSLDVPCKWDGDSDVQIALNHVYFLDLLKEIDGKEATVDLLDCLKPVMVHDSGSTHLLMPVRVH